MEINNSILCKDDNNWYVKFDEKHSKLELINGCYQSVYFTKETQLPLHKSCLVMVSEYGLVEGSEIFTYITKEYVEPKGIHCNRGSDVFYASIQLIPFIVDIAGKLSIIAAPSSESVKYYCGVKYKIEVKAYSSEDIKFTNAFLRKNIKETKLWHI